MGAPKETDLDDMREVLVIVAAVGVVDSNISICYSVLQVSSIRLLRFKPQVQC